MISIKGGTQTWSTSEQQSGLKGDSKRTDSAADMKDVLGKNKNIGEMLNKLTDPNWVDPAKMRKVGSNELGKDAFLKLLLAQMKNQDPTSPMESHEMAAQLAQFSSLEKLQNIDTGISGMAKGANNQDGQFDALTLIGKAVKGDSTQIIRANPEEAHEINFKLGTDAKKVSLLIKNVSGGVVRELEMRDLKTGQNVVTWNGMNEEGSAMGKGEYKVEIIAKNGLGRKIAAETKFEGVITGVNFTASGPVLLMGKQKVRMKDVKSILTPDQIQTANINKVDNDVRQKNSNVIENKAPQEALLDNVAMSRGLINNLSKRVGK